ncbi:MAG: twin-arginine translocase TatA/TatE family subunit [Myxococcota bacterium]
MFGLGTTELIIILVIVVMLFGVGKLPMVAKQLGSGIKEFKKELHSEDAEESAPDEPNVNNAEPKQG